MKAMATLGAITLLALSGCGSGEENPLHTAHASSLRASLAKEVPPGSNLDDVLSFLERKGLSPRYVESERVLYAHENIEPEPKSLVPFDLGLIKSADIRCLFYESSTLVRCSVEPSTKRWASDKGA